MTLARDLKVGDRIYIRNRGFAISEMRPYLGNLIRLYSRHRTVVVNPETDYLRMPGHCVMCKGRMRGDTGAVCFSCLNRCRICGTPTRVEQTLRHFWRECPNHPEEHRTPTVTLR